MLVVAFRFASNKLGSARNTVNLATGDTEAAAADETQLELMPVTTKGEPVRVTVHVP
jgi:hypothetical protein